MSRITDDLLKKIRFLNAASELFMKQKDQKITGRQRVLVVLNEEDGLIQSQLAEILDVRPSSLAELLKKMERDATIHRVEDESDKRLKRVFLTEKGKREVSGLHVKATRSEAFFQGLTEEEQKEFQRYVNKITNGWDSEIQSQTDRFADPLDRLRQMQAIRQGMIDSMGMDWRTLSRQERQRMHAEWNEQWRGMSREERKQMKESMRQEMRELQRTGQWGNTPHGFRPFGPRMDKRSSSIDEWEMPDDPSVKKEIKEEDWQDF